MDLDEYALNEAQRTLKRLGITHLWHTSSSEGQPDPQCKAPAEPQPVATRASVPASTASGRPGRDKAVRGRVAKPAPPAGRPDPKAAEQPLPPLLRALFHGKQSPCRTLWTYAGLYADLQQATVSARLDLFRKIQDSVVSILGWASRDVATWPLDLPERQFLKGVVFFRPTHIIGFGPSLELPSPPDGSEGCIILKECRIHVLPSLDAMAAGDRDMKNSAWNALKGIQLHT